MSKPLGKGDRADFDLGIAEADLARGLPLLKGKWPLACGVWHERQCLFFSCHRLSAISRKLLI